MKRWSSSEVALLLYLVGHESFDTIERRLLPRSPEAIRHKLRELGYVRLDRGMYSLGKLIRETGYNWKQILRAKKALNQRWFRTRKDCVIRNGNKNGRKYLILGDQAMDLMDYLKDEKYPFKSRHGTPRLTWSCKSSCCRECSTVSKPHYAKGLCEACYKRITRRRKAHEVSARKAWLMSGLEKSS